MKLVCVLRSDIAIHIMDSLAQYRELGVEVVVSDECCMGKVSRGQVLRAVADADLLLVGVEKVDRELIDAASSLKMISRFGAGYDNIDLEYAAQKGIIAVNNPGQNAASVADMVIGLMIDAARGITQANNSLKSGEFGGFTGVELDQKVLGIVGFGNVGRRVAARAARFGMRILAYDPFLSPGAPGCQAVEMVGLQELLKMSDFITLHAALTNDTRHLLNAQAFSLTKPGAVVINTARGGLIDTSALAEALERGRLGGAALDVFEEEPPRELKRALLRSNVILTPHLSGSTRDSFERIANMAFENFARFLRGEAVQNRVN